MIKHEQNKYTHVPKSTMDESNVDEIGYFSIVEWISTKYSNPSKPGHYFVSDGKGSVREAYYYERFSTAPSQPTLANIIFDEVDDVEIQWDDYTSLSNNELFEVCVKPRVWYTYEDSSDEYYRLVTIFKNPPAYWLSIPESDINGPIDSDTKSYPVHHLPATSIMTYVMNRPKSYI